MLTSMSRHLLHFILRYSTASFVGQEMIMVSRPLQELLYCFLNGIRAANDFLSFSMPNILKRVYFGASYKFWQLQLKIRQIFGRFDKI